MSSSRIHQTLTTKNNEDCGRMGTHYIYIYHEKEVFHWFNVESIFIFIHVTEMVTFSFVRLGLCTVKIQDII